MKYRMELIGSTVSRAVGVWPPEPVPVNAAPGLYLTRGDGVAVPVTAEMLAAALQYAEGTAGPATWESVAADIIAKLLEADHG